MLSSFRSRLQAVALTTFFVTGFLVVVAFPPRPYPSGVFPGREDGLVGQQRVPFGDVANAFDAWRAAPGEPGLLWAQRVWYPYVLAGLWVLAFIGVRLGRASRRDRRRRAWGKVLLAATGVVLVIEAAYLLDEYATFLPGIWGTIEGIVAYLAIAAILLYRRKADRRLDAVEATIAGQAFLAALHMITVPAALARQLLMRHDLGPIIEALQDVFRAPFWIALAALFIGSVPIYLFRGPAPDAPPPDPTNSA